MSPLSLTPAQGAVFSLCLGMHAHTKAYLHQFQLQGWVRWMLIGVHRCVIVRQQGCSDNYNRFQKCRRAPPR
jgi:hypothetical protein